MRKCLGFVIALISLAWSASSQAQTIALVSGTVQATAYANGPNGLLSGNPNPGVGWLLPGPNYNHTYVTASATAIDASGATNTGSFMMNAEVSPNAIGVNCAGVCVGGGPNAQSLTGGNGTFTTTVTLSSPATITMTAAIYNTGGASHESYCGGEAYIANSQGQAIYYKQLSELYKVPTISLPAGTYTFYVDMGVAAPENTTGTGTGAADFFATVPEPTSAAICAFIAALTNRRRRNNVAAH